MKITQILINILLIAVMASCDEKEEFRVPTMESFPMTIGTEWIYKRQIITKEYESPSSDKVIGTDTINSLVRVWVDKDTLLNDTMQVKILKSYEEGNDWTSNQYLFIDADGLRSYAFSIPWDPHVFANKNSSPLNALLKSSIFNQGASTVLDIDSIIVEDEPTLNIKLPLSEDSYWTYRYPTEYLALQIDKEVVGTEMLRLSGQQFPCFKVNWIYLFDPSFNYFTITDWISAKGLVKRLSVYDRMTYITHGGEDYVADFQVTVSLTLVEMKIK
jgi:hypothetical protein